MNLERETQRQLRKSRVRWKASAGSAARELCDGKHAALPLRAAGPSALKTQCQTQWHND